MSKAFENSKFTQAEILSAASKCFDLPDSLLIAIKINSLTGSDSRLDLCNRIKKFGHITFKYGTSSLIVTSVRELDTVEYIAWAMLSAKSNYVASDSSDASVGSIIEFVPSNTNDQV